MSYALVFAIMTFSSAALNLLDNYFKLRTIHPFIGGFDILLMLYAIVAIIKKFRASNNLFRAGLILFMLVTIIVDTLFFHFAFTNNFPIPEFRTNPGQAFGLTMKYFYNSDTGVMMFFVIVGTNMICSALALISLKKK